jgi:Transposase DNA-binding/Transposase DDE domain
MANAPPVVLVPSISEEFERADLGDARRTRRLVKLAEAVARAPSTSFPKLAASDAELEGTYRFLSNEDVGWRDVVRPHFEATATRCDGRDDVLVVHDSSDFRFKTEDDAREDLGLLNGYSGRGFVGHFALVVSDETTRTPLGVLNFEPVVRRKYAASNARYTPTERYLKLLRLPPEKKERERWFRGIQNVEGMLQGRSSPIHVMDRGADGYMLWSRLVTEGQRFVIRAVAYAGRAERIERALDGVETRLLREVRLSRRAMKPMRGTAKEHPARKARLAELCVRATTVTLKRGQTAPEAVEETTLNVVDVFEPHPPKGQEAVSWQLLTTEPIDTPEQVERIVDIYRARWVVEEYFKALKTGCAYERRQLMSLRALLNALAVFVPVAWRLLLLRTAARQTPSAPAGDYLHQDEVELLYKLSKRVKLSRTPSIEQALLAIAGLGGHLKRNGPPGWQTLAAGYQELCSALVGFRAAREM